jgi:hypothetical protein
MSTLAHSRPHRRVGRVEYSIRTAFATAGSLLITLLLILILFFFVFLEHTR